MTAYYFLTDQTSWENLPDKEREMLEAFYHRRIFLEEMNRDGLNALTADARLLIYLSDEQVKKVIPTLLQTQLPVAFLFHPEAIALNDGFALPSKMSTALTDIQEVKDVEIISYSPLTLSLTLVSDTFPSDDQLDRVKIMVEEKIDEDVELEIQVSMKK